MVYSMAFFAHSILSVALIIGWAALNVDGQAAAINVVGSNCGSNQYLKDGMNDCIIDAPIFKGKANQYTFRIAPGKPDFSVLLSLRTLDGVARMNVLTPDERVLSDNTVYNAHLNAVGESYIRLPVEDLMPGQYTISVGASQALKASMPVYLRVQTFNADIRLEPTEKEALAQIAKVCCKPPGKADGSKICDITLPGALGKDPNRDMCQVDNNVCDSEGHLTKLSLKRANFACPNFPKQFAAFGRLDTLDVSFNSFGEDTMANVAKVLSKAEGLERLVISYASLTGTIPCELFTDHKLKTIMLSFNGITGSLPACVLESPHLEELYMSRLNLTGAIPDVIPPGSNLRLWYALNTVEDTLQQYDGGAFSGSLPSTLPNAAGMRYLELSFHNLAGQMPALPEAMMVFDVSENNIGGIIPALPKNLLVLDVANNNLTGPFPDVSELADIGILDLSNNAINGELPQSFGAAAKSLSYFDARRSGIKGYLEATQWESCEQLNYLSLSGNELQGSIPRSIGTLTELTHLDLRDNNLGGDLSEYAAAIPKPGKARRRRSILGAPAAATGLTTVSSSSSGSSGCHQSRGNMMPHRQHKGVEGFTGAGALQQLLHVKWAARGQLSNQRSLLQTAAAPAATPSTGNFVGKAHTGVPTTAAAAPASAPAASSVVAAANTDTAAAPAAAAAPKDTAPVPLHTAAATTSRAAPAATPTIAVDPAVTSTSETPTSTASDTPVTTSLPPDTSFSDTPPTPTSSPDSSAVVTEPPSATSSTPAPDNTGDPQATAAAANSSDESQYDGEQNSPEDMGNVLRYLDLSGNQLTGSLPEELAHAQLFVDPSRYDALTWFRMSHDIRVFDVSDNKLHGEVPTWLLSAISTVKLTCGCLMYNNYTGNSLYCPTKSSMQDVKFDANKKIQLGTNYLTCLIPGREESPMLLSSYISKPSSWITSIPAPPEPVKVSSTQKTEPAADTLQATARSSSAGGSGSSSGLPAGAIAGLIVGIIGGLAVLAGLGYFGYKHLVQPKRATLFQKADIPDDVPLAHGLRSHPLPAGPAHV